MRTGTGAATAMGGRTIDPPVIHGGGVPRIGPNAIVQTLRALAESHGDEAAATLSRRADLPHDSWTALVPESWFIRVIRELRVILPPSEAEAVLRRAGALTGDYVRENRIPAPFRLALALLPPRVALPLLIRAFRRHAWTFAGSGRFQVEGPFPGTLVLDGAPTCRHARGPERSGSYYEAAFETLLSLACPGIRVREAACRAVGDPACRFRLELPSHSSPGGL